MQDISGHVDGNLEFKVQTQTVNGVIKRTSNLKITQPEIKPEHIEEVRNQLDTWSAATSSPVAVPQMR
ncbi:MAG: hypothetical protein PHH77_03775 [Victivallaceae bacterium]|nr:hypothetical protein [Victivallaceae bacterium]